MQSSLPQPTQAESRRIGLIKREIGCIACRLDGINCVQADAHHILDGSRRMGHEFTIPLCRFHHEHINSKSFEMRYGTELSLLETTNQLLVRYTEMVG